MTPADRSYDLIDAATYNFINSSRPPKILESPLDSKSLSAGERWGLFIARYSWHRQMSESSCVTQAAKSRLRVRKHTRAPTFRDCSS